MRKMYLRQGHAGAVLFGDASFIAKKNRSESRKGVTESGPPGRPTWRYENDFATLVGEKHQQGLCYKKTIFVIMRLYVFHDRFA